MLRRTTTTIPKPRLASTIQVRQFTSQASFPAFSTRLPTFARNSKQGFSTRFGSAVQQSQQALIVSFRQKSDSVAATTKLNGIPKNMTVLYGSQMGTAESIAKELATSINKRGINANVMSMEEFKQNQMNSLPEQENIVFVLSTFGNGEFPDNASGFMDFIGEKNDHKWLSKVNYTIFGLGYTLAGSQFNQSAKTLQQKLTELGANCFHDVVYSDECSPDGHDTALSPWTEALWKSLGVAEYQDKLSSSYKVIPQPSYSAMTNVPPPKYVPVKVTKTTSLTPSGYERPVNNLELDITGSGIKYSLCDQVLVLPRNSTRVVDSFLKFFGFQGDSVYSFEPLTGATPLNIPNKITLNELFSQYFDLHTCPSRKLIGLLSQLASSPKESKSLAELAESLEKYKELVSEMITINSFIQKYPSLATGSNTEDILSKLVSILPTMKPRSYSIASSPTVQPNKIRLIYGIPKTTTFTGLCSSYLSELKDGSMLNISTNSALLSHDDPTKPAIFVALGVGISSIMAILQERLELKNSGNKIGPCHLYFSVRHEVGDYILRDELEKYKNEGVLTSFVPWFTHDTPTPVWIMDKLIQDRQNIYSLLQDGAYFHYCGMGGQAPILIQEAVQKCVEVMGRTTGALAHTYIETLKKTGHWTIESFGTSLLDEFAPKVKRAGRKKLDFGSKSKSIPEIYEGSEMFCFQCEQTFENHGCHDGGVCGKTIETSALQDLLIETMKGVSQYAVLCRKAGLPEDILVNRFTLESMFSTLTNVNNDPDRFLEFVKRAIKHRDRLNASYVEHCRKNGISPQSLIGTHSLINFEKYSLDELLVAGKEFGVLSRLAKYGDDVGGLQEMLIYGMKGMAAYADHALMIGNEHQSIYEFIQEALDFLTTPKASDINEVLGMLMKCGQVGFTTLKLLDEAHDTFGTPIPTKVSRSSVAGKCIIVTGHDMKDMEALLKQTEGTGINVYTHGEMLTAHSYPELKKHAHLVGHFGTAWQMQNTDFEKFPGAILATTNCLIKPRQSYADRIFTCNVVGWPGIRHLENRDFSAVIASAKAAPGFESKIDYGHEDYLIGFGHKTVLSLAGKILGHVKAGDLKHVFVIGGCDGFEGERNYFTDLAQVTPSNSIILTVGCGKYRLNSLGLGEVPNTGLPRVLDMGQCNDSYSAVVVAVELAKALGCGVNDLPLSINLSWFEQKAVLVLLTLLSLGIKNIRIGPRLPAFVTPTVLGVLVNKFGLKPTGVAKVDLERMLANDK